MTVNENFGGIGAEGDVVKIDGDDNASWGASPSDWAHFDIVLGLGEDLLPVVSNPHAEISEKSSIKTLGKVPSLYNKAGFAVGIADWTSKKSTETDLAKWEKIDDYGICVQTRQIRALDIDVIDVGEVSRIEAVIKKTLGFSLPTRYRANSAKRLFIYSAGEGCSETKRILPVTGGIIEYLAIGQQFVAVGTHTSGERYEWGSFSEDECEGGLPLELSVLDGATEDLLWQALVDEFGVSDVVESGSGARKPKNTEKTYANDDLAESLEILGIALSRGRDGTVYIECPWKAEHTEGGAGDSETGTTYFPAGGRDYQFGHFKCLHAHCAGRSDMDFKVKLGIEEEGGGFDTLEPLTEAERSESVGLTVDTLEYALITNDEGRTLANVSNLHAVLMSPTSCRQYIKYDTFRDEIVWKPVDGAGWWPFRDTDYTRLRVELERTGFMPISSYMMKDIVRRIADLQRIDTAQEWLNPLVWDGVERVERFMINYMGAEDTAYNRAVGEYTWAALAGRVVCPGCKADAAPIFVGEQYAGKSYAIACMVPDIRMFTEVRLDDNEDNLSRKMRGKLISEFAELRGLHTKELEGIKAFISRQYEEWVPKYMEFSTIYPRRLLFIGTSNKDELFTDDTGNRKWFPVNITKGRGDLIIRDCEQLWAEGREMFLRQDSVQSFYDKANGLAHATREDFMITDVWEDAVGEWLHAKDDAGEPRLAKEFVQIGDIMFEALGINKNNFKTYDAMRIGKILHKHGYKKAQRRINGSIIKVWVRVKPLEAP